MAVIGYARVSTHEQSLDLQVDALKRSGCDEIYTEQASGKSAKQADRPELDHCLRALRPGDTGTWTAWAAISMTLFPSCTS